MTFGNYILRLRQRLQDLRTSSGVVITTISDNGIRWSANNLIEIANASITEVVRLVNQYSNSNLMKSLGEGFFEASTQITMSGGTGLIPSTILNITSVTMYAGPHPGGDARPFIYIPPDKYDEVIGDNSLPRSNMWVYTVRYSLTLAQRRLYAVKGNEGCSGIIVVTGIYNKSDYGVNNDNDTIFLLGLDDFLLDVAERECRDREHNWERSQILDVRIALKLGLSGGKQ